MAKFDLSVILRFIDKSAQGLKGFQANMGKVGKKMQSVGKSMSMAVTLPLVAMGGFALKSAIDMESAFTGVQKTVNGTAEELAALKESIKGLSLKIPISAVELFGVAEAAGQLGIKIKNIAGFTKVMADLGATTDLSSEAAASQLARFANITQMSQDDFDKLGSVIVDLGNNMATTESKIVAMALRLAGAGKTVGLNEAQILSLSAALSSVGIEAEAGGSAFSKVLKEIDKSVGSGSKKMDTFALVAGKSTAEFEKAWKENAASAVLDFIKGLDEAQKKGVNINQGLDELGFTGLRVSDALLRASGANKLFNQAQNIGKKAWKENNALQKEAALRYKTTASQLVLFKNNINLLGNSFGKIMLPGLNKMLEKLKPFIDGLKKLSPEMKDNILKIAGIFLIGGPLLLGLGAAAVALSAISLPVIAIAAAIAGVTVGLAFLMLEAEKDRQKLNKDIDKAAAGGLGGFRQAEAANKRGVVAQGGFETANLRGLAISGLKGTPSEIIVKVEAADRTSALVTGVKGDRNVKVENEAYVGPTFGAMTFGMGS